MPSAFEVSVAVRAARPGDTPFVRQLAARAFAEYDPTAEQTTSELLLEPGARLLLAERGQRRLGFVLARRETSGALSLNAIAVIPEARGRGVGRRLLQAAEQLARAQGLGTMKLNTAQANLAALELFLRAGFVITDRAARRYHGGQPACRLEKRLR